MIDLDLVDEMMDQLSAAFWNKRKENPLKECTCVEER